MEISLKHHGKSWKSHGIPAYFRVGTLTLLKPVNEQDIKMILFERISEILLSDLESKLIFRNRESNLNRILKS
jgi:hypothetical protein